MAIESIFCLIILMALLKKGLWHRCLPVNFVKFLRALFYRTSLDDWFYIIITHWSQCTTSTQPETFKQKLPITAQQTTAYNQ